MTRRADLAWAAAGLALGAIVAWAAFAPARPAALDPAEARQVLSDDPMNPAGARDLALALERGGKARAAEAMMRAAGRLGWRDAPTQAWLFRRDLAEGRLDDAVAHADALMLRPVDDPVRPAAAARLAAALDIPGAPAALARRLTSRPFWREAFLDQLGRDKDHRDRTRAVLQALASGPAPPSAIETAALVNGLVDDGRYAEAQSAWLAFSPAAAAWKAASGPTFDGAQDATAFSWKLEEGAGLDLSGAAGRLWIDRAGQGPWLAARRLMALPPGRYRVQWAGRGDAGRRLSLQVACVGDPAPLAQAPSTVGGGAWAFLELDLTVPSGRCDGQWLQIAAAPFEPAADLRAAYARLAVRPLR